jgi:hypothetical protein
VINSTLELDEVLQVVMDTIVRLTEAERGFLMLAFPTKCVRNSPPRVR